MKYFSITVIYIILLLLIWIDIVSMRVPQKVFFDDFGYANAVQMFSENVWAGRSASYKAWSIKEPPGNFDVFSAQKGIATITKPAHVSMPSVDFESQIRFYYGTYAVRIRFADTPRAVQPPEPIIQYFCAISRKTDSETEPYCEFDLEYLDYDIWKARSEWALYGVSWHKRSNQHAQWYNDTRLGVKWLVLILKIYDAETAKLKDTPVNFEIWEETDTGLILLKDVDWNKLVPDRYLAKTEMKMAFGVWRSKRHQPDAPGMIDHKMDIDWALFMEDLFPTCGDVIDGVRLYREKSLSRIDTLKDVSRSYFYLRYFLYADVILSFGVIVVIRLRKQKNIA